MLSNRTRIKKYSGGCLTRCLFTLLKLFSSKIFEYFPLSELLRSGWLAILWIPLAVCFLGPVGLGNTWQSRPCAWRFVLAQRHLWTVSPTNRRKRNWRESATRSIWIGATTRWWKINQIFTSFSAPNDDWCNEWMIILLIFYVFIWKIQVSWWCLSSLSGSWLNFQSGTYLSTKADGLNIDPSGPHLLAGHC